MIFETEGVHVIVPSVCVIRLAHVYMCMHAPTHQNACTSIVQLLRNSVQSMK
jgi:hypothetical protein